MCCETHSCGCGEHRSRHGHGHQCDCGGGSLDRRYISPQEEREMVERYIDDLKKELAGAEARLSALS